MKHSKLRLLIPAVGVCLMGIRLAGADDAVEPSPTSADRLFTLKVRPLLETKCFGCHGNDADDLKGELDVRTREALLTGGESGDPAVIPGRPEESLLYQAVLWDGYEMPPKENDRLTEQETGWIQDWIAAGAPWPDEQAQRAIREQEWSVLENEDGVIVTTSGGLSDDWTYRRYDPEAIWAFRALTDPDVPRGARHPIDAFIGQALNDAGLTPASRAEPRDLIRRASYDLIGLPPTPREVSEFLQAWEADADTAWQALIDRLLASPHYGERWGQHWLDVARYADTAGYSNDYERSNAWRYRDYVVRSFNADKPYDQFVIEQIAGDELVERQQAEGGNESDIAPSSFNLQPSEAAVATGFLRMGPWGTAMVQRPQYRQSFLDDVTHNVGQTFLSLPLRCCRCHDHKFDPIPTQDYYRIYATFSATQPAEMPAVFLEEENREGFDAKQAHVERLLAFAEEDRVRLVEKREQAAREWYAERDREYVDFNTRRGHPDTEKPPRHVGLDHVDEGTLKVREQDVWIWTRRLERFRALAQSVYNGPDVNQNGRKLRAPGRIDQSWRPESVIYTGGALEAPGDAVTPGVISGANLAAAGAGDADPYALPDGLSGRRLALAEWMADPANPLTTRSIVNRIWQYHFGAGIVRSANNFGGTGSRPTHPELLDWLASDFVANGWTMKRLHRLIMTSHTYQQSTQHADLETVNTVDPDNRLLARFLPRRLTAEELRDSMLAISGELNRDLGGVPIMPEINMEVALQPRMIQFSIAPAHQPSRTPAERNRRSIYAYRVRGQADPFLEVLNLPNPNESCDFRETAAVTPQAFTLMNSDVMTDRSIAFALRLKEEFETEPEQIRRAFQLAYGRVPNAGEQDRLITYLGEMQNYHEEHVPEAVPYPTEIIRSLVEEFSGRPFEYTEILPVFEDYVPDAKPWTVDADTRALADVCHLILNSNEFVYVY